MTYVQISVCHLVSLMQTFSLISALKRAWINHKGSVMPLSHVFSVLIHCPAWRLHMSFAFKLEVASQLSLTSQFRILLVRLEVKLDCPLLSVMALISLLCPNPECSTVPAMRTRRSAHTHTQFNMPCTHTQLNMPCTHIINMPCTHNI